jgi:glycerol-3-phosphate responsive antiterminator
MDIYAGRILKTTISVSFETSSVKLQGENMFIHMDKVEDLTNNNRMYKGNQYMYQQYDTCIYKYGLWSYPSHWESKDN